MKLSESFEVFVKIRSLLNLTKIQNIRLCKNYTKVTRGDAVDTVDTAVDAVNAVNTVDTVK